MPASRLHLVLCAAWVCLAGCQPNVPNVTSTSARGGGSETTLVGRVLDDSGHAVAGASVWMRNEEDSPFDFSGLDSGAASHPLAYSDVDGKYRIDGVHAGLRYLIECRGSIGRAAAVFAQAEDEDTVHAPDAILRPTGTVRGRMRIPDSLFSIQNKIWVYAYIPGLWQRSVTNSDTPSFEIRDVPAGTYALRLQPAFPFVLSSIGMLEIAGVRVEPGETTDVGELTLPLRASTTASAAYARDSAVVASFGTLWDSPPDVEGHSAVLGNRIIFLYDFNGQFTGITNRVRDLDALESIYLINFQVLPDSLNPDKATSKPLSPIISELPHLRRLWLPGMPASGYPQWTGAFPALTSLNLANAGLTSIPDWVLERKRLAYLELAVNRLETLPNALSGLHDLRILDLDGNRLQSLPAILPAMKSLQGVNLRRNRICSTTPAEKAWIGHQDSLWLQQQDPLASIQDTLSWDATQDCGKP